MVEGAATRMTFGSVGNIKRPRASSASSSSASSSSAPKKRRLAELKALGPASTSSRRSISKTKQEESGTETVDLNALKLHDAGSRRYGNNESISDGSSPGNDAFRDESREKDDTPDDDGDLSSLGPGMTMDPTQIINLESFDVAPGLAPYPRRRREVARKQSVLVVTDPIEEISDDGDSIVEVKSMAKTIDRLTQSADESRDELSILGTPPDSFDEQEAVPGSISQYECGASTESSRADVPGVVNHLGEQEALVGSVGQNRYSTPRESSGVESPTMDDFPALANCLTKLYDGMVMPAYIRQLPPLQNLNIPQDIPETFSKGFLQENLGGTLQFGGWYAVNAKKRRDGNRLVSKCTSYVLLSKKTNPLLPPSPGEHGAQMSAFLFSVHDNNKFPDDPVDFTLFVEDRPGKGYRYYGIYNENRWSDRMGYNEQINLPARIKEYWSKSIGRKEKALWQMQVIKKNWPKVPAGWIDDDSGEFISWTTENADEMEMNHGDPIMRPISDAEAIKVREAEVLEALDACDVGPEPSIRLFYEYMQCTGFDQELYETLVRKKHEAK